MNAPNARIKPQAPQGGAASRREKESFWRRLVGVFRPKAQKEQLEELQGRWGRLMRDAQELEMACVQVQSTLLTADRARDPQAAEASMAEANRQLKRVSELLAVFTLLRNKYRAPFSPSQKTLTQIKGVSHSAMNLRQRKEQVKRISGESIRSDAADTLAEASAIAAVPMTPAPAVVIASRRR